MSDLYFNKDGWLESDNSWMNVFHAPTTRFWPRDRSPYSFKGTITHYDALHSAERTVKGFTRNAKGASTHFVIARNGDIHQLVSVNNKAWHAALKEGVDYQKGERGFLLPDGTYTKNPNHWFIGIDLSNLGYLTKRKDNSFLNHYKAIYQGPEPVYLDNRYWEPYTQDAKDAYVDLQAALLLEFHFDQSMHFRHSDVSPKRKSDPGPAFPFDELISESYSFYEAYRDFDDDRMGDEEEL